MDHLLKHCVLALSFLRRKRESDMRDRHERERGSLRDAQKQEGDGDALMNLVDPAMARRHCGESYVLLMKQEKEKRDV